MNIHKYLFSLICSTILLVSCSLPSGMAPLPRLTPSALPTLDHCAPLSPANLPQLSLRRELKSTSRNPVVAIAFSANGQWLIVAQSSSSDQKGVVTQWALDSAIRNSYSEIEWIHPELTRLNQTGEWLITVEDQSSVVDQRRQEHPDQIADWVKGFTEIWETTTGQQRSAKPEPRKVLDLDIAPDGKQYLNASGSVNLMSTDPMVTFGGEGLILEAEDHIPIPSVVAFDRNAKTYAYATEDGEIGVRPLVNELKSEHGIFISPLWGKYGKGKPLDLDFDPTRNRLALLREESIVVFNIQTILVATTLLEEDFAMITKGNVVFSPTSMLLAISTPDRWQVRGKNGWNILFEQEVSDLSTINFNHDGCFIALGFDNGAVEIWGIPPH